VSRLATAGAAAHAFVDDLDDPALTPEDHHHLARVLRLRPGDVVTVGDGRGAWRTARFGDVIEPVGSVVREPAPVPELAVAFAVLKGDRPELVVQKLTEIGVDRVVPFHAARCVARWDGERATRHVERLRRVTREAAMQSRRAWLPVVEPVTTFADVAARPGAALASPGGVPPHGEQTLVLVGPEGGWSPDELACGLSTVDLGPHVLRAETAALAAGVLLVASRRGRDATAR
jgi:16S rRNA (uracil1498-N3)-methyltransferase